MTDETNEAKIAEVSGGPLAATDAAKTVLSSAAAVAGGVAAGVTAGAAGAGAGTSATGAGASAGKHTHLTIDAIMKGCTEEVGANPDGVRICRINHELSQGITEMEAYEKSVTFYGSARFKEGDEYYEKARHLAYRIAKELDFAVATGGGPGIMEGGNRGAFEAGGKSVGLSIKLPREQHDNPYTTDQIPFYFFFTRKLSMKFSSRVGVFFPGGFGTFDEFFEVLTLVQTKKLKSLPLVLYGTDFWNPFMDVIRKVMLDKFHTIGEDDFNLFTVTDDDDLVLDIIRKAPPRDGNHED